MKTFTLLAVILSGFISQAQVGIGEWREHFSYSKGVALCKAGTRIYCSTTPSLFYYDTQDNSIQKVSKIQGLSDLEIEVVKYSEKHETLIIGYSNGNIDLIANNKIINVPDIKRSFIQASKSVNEILINDDFAYLSTGFGIIALDLVKKEISETFNLGAGGTYLQVNETCIKNDTIYAGCTDGIYYGSLNDNLIDFQNWVKMTGIPSGNYNTIVSLNDKLVCNFQLENEWQKDTIFAFENGSWQKVSFGTNYNNENIHDLNVFGQEIFACSSGDIRVLDENFNETHRIYEYNPGSKPQPREAIKDGDEYWIADRANALVHQYGGTNTDIIIPSGPFFSDSWRVKYSSGHLWVTTGALAQNMKFSWSTNGIAHFFEEEWDSYFGGTIFDSLRAVHAIAIHPDDPNHVFAASYGGGVLEFKDGERVNIFNETNSTIQSIEPFPFRAVGELIFDKNNQLWIANGGLTGESVSHPLKMYDLNGNWYQYNLNNVLTSTSLLSGIMVDKNGNKWLNAFLKGVIVFNENGTLADESDDSFTLLTVSETGGNLPSNEVYSVAEDADGKIWIGSSAGLSVINNPENIFESAGVTAERVIIEVDGNANYLLSDAVINKIKIDGGDRKWIGTDGAGLYLMSADMQTEIFHFTTLNSPIISDVVLDIEINEKTGEVYISTDKGLVSFMGSATSGSDYDGPTYAFPNPVPPGFTGTIGIRGVVDNAEIKITDIAGHLIYETIANGTTATWDGKSLNGKKAQSGVYIVFISNSDGTETEITKILFLN
ncbi:MAG: hypothetical protein ACJAZ2_001345 [Glaciecola sp.]|jgi:hypothetical protein